MENNLPQGSQEQIPQTASCDDGQPTTDISPETSLTTSTTEAVTTDKPVKRKKLPKSILGFIDSMKFNFPEEELDFSVDENNQFTCPTVSKYFKIYTKGRDAQRFYEPELFIIGKLTDDGEIQLSDSPRIMRSAAVAQRAITTMSQRFGGLYMTFGLPKAFVGVLRKRLLLDDTEALQKLKVCVRPNHKAK